jgi:hypothetical protein
MDSNFLAYAPLREAYDAAYEAEWSARQARFRAELPWFLRRHGKIFMANNPLFYDATVIAAVGAAVVLLNSGFIKVYTGAQPTLDGSVTGTLLATLTFGATAFISPAVASAGTVTATANGITNGTAGNSGTAGYFAVVKSDNSTVVGTGVCSTTSGDMILNSLSIAAGAIVSCSAFTVTQPQT